MPIVTPNRWVRGTIAGVLGGTVLALWFLIIDAALGQPFHTPALLANALFGVEGLEARPGMIVAYTFVHYALFVGVGIGVTWLFASVDWGPSLLLGLVLGFILFDIAFYASIYLTGIEIVEDLGWVEVLTGNVAAGLTIMGYLYVAGEKQGITWWEALGEHKVVKEGLIVGLIGAGAVAGWFFFFDLTRGQPLFTPGALGSALFLGASSVDMVQVSFGTVAGYTLVHVLAFLFVGVVASAVAWEAEESPPLILGAILLFVAFEAFFLGLLAVVAEFLLGPIAWWSIAVGNLLAVVSMCVYLWKRHPKLQGAFSADPFDRTY